MADDLADDSSAVLSDVDDEDATSSADPSALHLPATTTATTSDQAQQRIRDLLNQLDQERRSRQETESALKRREESINRLRAFAQDLIKKRDDALREKDDALKEREEILKQKETLKSEVDLAAQMMVTGIDKISNKISNFKNFDGGLPRSQKYATGIPAITYGVIKRSNEIVEELVKQIEGITRSRDQAREQIEQRNYEIAIEVSQLEASIGELKDEVLKKDKEVEKLEGLAKERDAKFSELEKGVSELEKRVSVREERLRGLEEKMDSMRPLVIDELRNVSRLSEKVNEIVRIVDGVLVDQCLDSDSSFVYEEMDIEENLRALVKGTVSVYESAKVAVEKVRIGIEERGREIDGLMEKVDGLLSEKQYIGTLLRSALQSKTNEVLQVAEDGLREARIDLRLNGDGKSGVEGGEEDEVYTLAGALENTVKASQLEIIELKHLVDALRAESSLLEAHLDAQAKELNQQSHKIKELEQKEHLANESVEGLMLDITAAEDEIARWKEAAEQEAAAGRAVEQEFLSRLSGLRQELDETKQAMSELENKLKFKEETAAAAIAARDAAENSLRLADLRSTRLRERVEELSRQIEESDNRTGHRNSQANHRYVCWPWQWLGLNFVRHPNVVQEDSNEMELSEPLI